MTYSDAQSESRKGWLRMPASLADQAYEGLLAAIGEGRLRPGDRVRETALAAELGISRTPIREALQRLRSEEHTSELQSLMRIPYAVFCLTNKPKISDDTI